MNLEYLKQYVVDFLDSNDVDLYTKYKNTANYNRIKDNWVYCDEYGEMSLEEFIERFLLTKDEVIASYDSIYDMGNPYILDDQECSIKALTLEIVKAVDLLGENEIIELEKSVESVDKKSAHVARKAQVVCAKVIEYTLTREDGGYGEQLKNHLDIDLDLYDDNNLRYKSEKMKILWFLHFLKKRYGTKVLELFSKPSMENIDYSYIGMETHNGNTMRLIKNSLGKELSLSVKINILNSLQMIVTSWESMIVSTIFQIEMMNLQDKASIEEIVSLLLNPIIDKFIFSEKVEPHSQSPVETFYLKTIQYEYLCHIYDAKEIYHSQINTLPNVSKAYIDAFRNHKWRKIPISEVEEYIHKNAQELAKWVWFGSKTDKEKNRVIRNNKQNVLRWIEFCFEARPYANIEESITDSMIISCLQAFIFDGNEEFDDYTFPLYQRHWKHMPSDQSVLKSNYHISDAKQIYWVYKVLDRLYTNSGMLTVRKKMQDYVTHCYNILIDVLHCSSICKILDLHEIQISHQKRVAEQAIELAKQAYMLQHFKQFLRDKDFLFFDAENGARYVFSCYTETTYICDALVSYVNLAMISNESYLHFRISENLKKGYTPIDIALVFGEDDACGVNSIIDFKLLLDYQNKTCTMMDVNMRDKHKD